MEGVTTNVLLRSESALIHTVEDDKGTKSVYVQMDFYVVNLKGAVGEVRFKRLPSLYSRCGTGSMVKLGTRYFVFGGLIRRILEKKPPKLTAAPACQRYTGGASLDVSMRKGGWQSAPVPKKNNRILPICAAVNGKIYCFGANLNSVEVFDPSVGAWKVIPGPPPSHLSGSMVSVPVVPDPSNHRLLVHLSGHAHGLYAFYPEDGGGGGGGKWVLVSDEMCNWPKVATVANGLLLLHDFDIPGLLSVFDLATCTWFDVLWSENNFQFSEISHLEFDSLFPLNADKTLCLARYAPPSESDPAKCITTLYFLPFTLLRSATRPSVIVTPLAFSSHALPCTDKVYDFLPLTSQETVVGTDAPEEEEVQVSNREESRDENDDALSVKRKKSSKERSEGKKQKSKKVKGVIHDGGDIY